MPAVTCPKCTFKDATGHNCQRCGFGLKDVKFAVKPTYADLEAHIQDLKNQHNEKIREVNAAIMQANALTLQETRLVESLRKSISNIETERDVFKQKLGEAETALELLRAAKAESAANPENVDHEPESPESQPK